LQYQCEFAEAGMELQRAVELNPNYATAHHWYAIHLAGMGRVQEALAENERARRLDPFSLPINFYRTGLLIGQRQFDQANEQIEILAALAPDAARRQRASLYWAQDRVPEAIAEEKLAAGFEAMPGSPPSYWDEVAQAYARGGKQAALLRAAQVRELACTNPSQVRGRGLHCDYGDIAISYEATGDKEKTLHWLKPAIKQARDSINGQCWVANTLETGYADLRSDPRFQEILRSLGLPE